MNEYEKAKFYFDEGVKFYQNKNYEKAKKSFLECLRLRFWCARNNVCATCRFSFCVARPGLRSAE